MATKSASEEEGTSLFAKQLLDVLNSVRTTPSSIVRALQEQMHQVDDHNVLDIPGRDPI